MENASMPYTLEQLATDIRTTLEQDPGPAGKAAICRHVSRALADTAFVAEHLRERAAGANPREILYEDPTLGFCICGHVYAGAARGSPHDHGPSWAVYGQAAGTTEMTDWRIVEEGFDDKPSLVEPARTYVLRPGEAHLYDVGAVHSPDRAGSTKLVRIEGQNLDHVRRSNIRAKAPAPVS
jgi:predicted metal-dependent enzyme (double-stranded beta helix superfamily)